MNINLTIIPNDTKTVAKIVLYDDKKRILMLKRNKHVKKHANEWDLPGGHIRKGEDLISGLFREVKEETNIKNFDAIFFKKMKNKHFFFAECDFDKNKMPSSGAWAQMLYCGTKHCVWNYTSASTKPLTSLGLWAAEI